MTASTGRPRVVEAAFWCWISAAILLVFVCGLMALSSNPALYRVTGAVGAVAGLAIGGLAFPTRNGHNRLRWASVALSLMVIGLMILMTLWTRGLFWLVVIALLLVAATLVTRQAAEGWFTAAGRQGGGDD